MEPIDTEFAIHIHSKRHAKPLHILQKKAPIWKLKTGSESSLFPKHWFCYTVNSARYEILPSALMSSFSYRLENVHWQPFVMLFFTINSFSLLSSLPFSELISKTVFRTLKKPEIIPDLKSGQYKYLLMKKFTVNGSTYREQQQANSRHIEWAIWHTCIMGGRKELYLQNKNLHFL